MRDEMQLLVAADPKPSAGKRKIGPVDFVEPQNLPIKQPRAFQVRDSQTNVVNSLDLHYMTYFRSELAPCNFERALALRLRSRLAKLRSLFGETPVKSWRSTDT